jgi:cadherin EGF LAG seven-pass G-type receptor 1
LIAFEKDLTAVYLEYLRRFVLSLTATDDGGRLDSATLYVNVTDANTHVPSFQSGPYSATVLEDTPVGATVLVVTATDGDVGENARLTYVLAEGVEDEDPDGPFFAVNPATGAVVTARKLDRETRTGFLLTVTARDNGSPPLSDATDVEILVADVNDNAPRFHQTSSYTAEVSESAEPGTSIVRVSAVDADEELNGQVRLFH